MVRPPPTRVVRRVGRCGTPDGGYTLIALIVATTILGILLAAALPVWSQVMKREREAELVFRGVQYAEAIRVFQRRYGRYPNRLAELVEVRPRSIRQLWKDPITDGEWGLVYASAAGRPGSPPPAGLPPNANTGGMSPEEIAMLGGGGGGAAPPAEEESGRTETGFGSSTDDIQPAGPIIGVYSRSSKESVRTLFGQQTYNRWRFVVDKIPLPTPGPSGAFPVFSSATYGRPFAGGVQPQVGLPPGAPQSGSGPGGPQPAGGKPGAQQPTGAKPGDTQ